MKEKNINVLKCIKNVLEKGIIIGTKKIGKNTKYYKIIKSVLTVY